MSAKLREWAKITSGPKVLKIAKGLTLEFLEEPFY